MRIVFVHAPIPLRNVDSMSEYWENFDVRYKAVHPGMRPIRNALFELPHWITWLAGVTAAAGFGDLGAMELYTSCTILNWIDEDLIRTKLLNEPADVYLLSPLTINLPQTIRIAEIAKELHPRCVTIFGGVVSSPLHARVARHPAVDYVVRDRGEYALPALLHALRDGNADLSDIGQLTWTPEGADEPVTNGRMYPQMPVADIPFPVVDMFPKETGLDLRYIRQNYALGCPFTCDYCTIQTIGRKPQYFPIKRVLAEIDAYRRHYGSHHHVYFGDETFTLHPQRTLDICDALTERGDIVFDCQTRLNCLTDSRIPPALYSAGGRWVEIGLESINQGTQDSYKQHTRLSDVRDTLARLRDAGLATCTHVIVGFPNETTDDMYRTLEFVCDLIDDGLLYAAYHNVLVPHPGTPMFTNPEKYGMRIHHRSFDLYSEELPPVFDSAKTPSDRAYKVFLDTVSGLAQAMSRTPALTGPLPRTAEKYGEFYNSYRFQRAV